MQKKRVRAAAEIDLMSMMRNATPQQTPPMTQLHMGHTHPGTLWPAVQSKSGSQRPDTGHTGVLRARAPVPVYANANSRSASLVFFVATKPGIVSRVTGLQKTAAGAWALFCMCILWAKMAERGTTT